MEAAVPAVVSQHEIMPPIDYKGWVAIIIAGSLGASVMMCVLALSWKKQSISETGGEVLIAIVSGLLVALGYFMGGKNGKQ
jgi:hypothetical protein